MDEMVDRLLDILADKLTERLSAGHKELYTAKELAERYGVSCATIRSKMAAGEFGELVSVGERTRLVPWAGVQAYESTHTGILGDAGSDILMIAGVHEYGATISAKNVKHLAIPLNMEAKNAGSPRKFNDLRFIPISPGYGFLVRDRKHPQKAPGRKKQEKHDAKKHPSGGEEDPRPNEDYEWMYMLVDSVTIPERSFIRASFDTGKATLENICKEAVDGIILKKWTAQEAADYIGKWAVEMTHDYFNTKLSPPKSATTQLTSTQYQPLFDTGRLYNSISYSVEGI